MNLSNLSVDELNAARVDLDHQIAALRARKLEIAREIEARYPEPDPQERPAAQTMAPGFIESESVVPSLDDPPRRRWFGR